MKVQLIYHWLQSRKGNVVVTLDTTPAARMARVEDRYTPISAAGTISLVVASSFHGEQELSPPVGRWYSLRGESCESAEVHRAFS